MQQHLFSTKANKNLSSIKAMVYLN